MRILLIGSSSHPGGVLVRTLQPAEVRSALRTSDWVWKLPYTRALLAPFSCPEATTLFVASLNMNTDYGFFQLFRALKYQRDNKNKSRFCEEPSEVEERLPHINYSLLTSLPVHEQRYQQNPFRSKRFDFGIAATTACPDYNS